MSALPLQNALCVALDVDSDVEALKIAHDLRGVVGGFKLGPRLVQRYGQRLIFELAEHSAVFVDLKFFDIPSTMLAAVRASFEAGASLVTVHALAGAEALTELAKLELELNRRRPFRILAVTILTSWNQNSLPLNFKQQSIGQHVKDLADLAGSCGIKSLVCSAEELELLKDKGLYLVTPGIRLPEDEVGDQKRVVGPRQALALGASALVVGRPIIAATDPLKAAKKFLLEIGA